MRRLFSFKTLFLIALAAGVGAVVALVVTQKKKFAGMSEEEIRGYLDQKLGSRMSEDQVKQIQDAVVAAVKGVAEAKADAYGAVSDASDEITDVVKEAAEEAVEEAEAEVEAEELEEAIEESVDEA